MTGELLEILAKKDRSSSGNCDLRDSKKFYEFLTIKIVLVLVCLNNHITEDFLPMRGKRKRFKSKKPISPVKTQYHLLLSR